MTINDGSKMLCILWIQRQIEFPSVIERKQSWVRHVMWVVAITRKEKQRTSTHVIYGWMDGCMYVDVPMWCDSMVLFHQHVTITHPLSLSHIILFIISLLWDPPGPTMFLTCVPLLFLFVQSPFKPVILWNPAALSAFAVLL